MVPHARWARVAAESATARMVDSWEVRIVVRRRPRPVLVLAAAAITAAAAWCFVVVYSLF